MIGHKHRWIPVGVDIAETKFSSDQEYTIVLQRCGCGGYHTVKLEGRWTEENVGINEDTIRDLLALAKFTSATDVPW